MNESHVKNIQSIGKKFAPIFYGYVKDIQTFAKSLSNPTIYYCTREGEFFLKLHQAIGEKAELLEVSRISTLLPSLESLDNNDFARIWGQYPLQSPTAFFTTLGLDWHTYEKELHEYMLVPDEKYELKDNPSFKKFLTDKNVMAKLRSSRDDKRNLLLEYLSQKGIHNHGNIVIADIGWKGTMQDNISYLLPNAKTFGKYLAVYPSHNPAPINAKKMGYIADYNYSNAYDLSITKNFSVFEMLTNSHNGSVISYERKNNKVLAIRKKDAAEDEVYINFTQHFQTGVIQALPELEKIYSSDTKKIATLKNTAIKLASELSFIPPDEIISAFFTLKHNETFGNGIFYDLEKRSKFKGNSALILFNKQEYQKFWQAAKTSLWYDAFWIKNRYRWFMTIRYYLKRFFKN